MTAILLIAIDGSPQAEALLRLAISHALALDAAAEVICVIDPGYSLGDPDHRPPSADEQLDYPGPAHEQEGAEQAVQAAVAQLRAGGVKAEGHVATGEPVEVICARARQLGCELIVLGHRHRQWFARLREGSVCHAVIEQAPCPVLVQTPHDSAS